MPIDENEGVDDATIVIAVDVVDEPDDCWWEDGVDLRWYALTAEEASRADPFIVSDNGASTHAEWLGAFWAEAWAKVRSAAVNAGWSAEDAQKIADVEADAWMDKAEGIDAEDIGVAKAAGRKVAASSMGFYAYDSSSAVADVEDILKDAQS
jgi:hypothetical protein